ncbi:MAG: hypothetical protein JW860_11810 [Sedimentisphaerales bacterium]|nr:hypothetical protein [Sedimentisphaerales bacterium]
MDRSELDNLKRLMDYQLHLDDPRQRQQTEELLDKDKQAQKLNDSLKQILDPLGSWSDEPAPEGLADRTLELITQHEQARTMAAASEAIARRQDSGYHQRRDRHSRVRWVLGNLRDLVTVAACLMLAVTALRPGLQHARQRSNQIQCAKNMAMTSQALYEYAQDNNNMLPNAGYTPGSVWWKVGAEDKNDNSNTRNVFLLIKGDYLPPETFICPGSKKKPSFRIKIDPELLAKLQDFASREQVNYSFRLFIDKKYLDHTGQKLSDGLIMADQNPLFADFDIDRQKELDLTVDPSLLRVNSPNHGGIGQNILYNDGHVDFTSARHMGPSLDDIYTIKDVNRYHGTELPADNDIFIAP